MSALDELSDDALDRAFDAAVASHMAASRGEPVPAAPTAAAARAAVTGIALGGDRRGYVHHSAAVRDAVATAAGRSGDSVRERQPAADDDGGAQRRHPTPPAGLPPQPPPPPAPPAWLYADADAFR